MNRRTRSPGLALALPTVFMTLACKDPAGGGTDEACQDETGIYDEGAEEGDGCLFVPYCAEAEDDGPDYKLDMGVFPDMGCDPDCPPPPGYDPPEPPFMAWTYHSGTDTYYRYATEMELEVHDWVSGTILMSADTTVAALTNGTNTTLGVPIGSPTGGIEIEPIALANAQTRNDTWFVTYRDAAVGPMRDVFRPDFHLFLPSWVDFEALERPRLTDVFIWAYGDSHGGVAVQGMTADQEFSILGPSIELWLETLPPDHNGVLVVTPTFFETNFDVVLDHWVSVLSNFCGGNDCDLDPNIPMDPGNCADCLDNDQDEDLDTDDLYCKHRPEFGCGSVGDHNHRWENAKDFATMPDIEWCTQMEADGMPWQADLNMKGSTAAAMLNAIPMALEWMHVQEEQEAIEVPDDVPTIRHRLAYCAFADDVDAARDCVDDEQDCPPNYHLGGVTHSLPAEPDADTLAYFGKLWDEFDEANAGLEAEGITPKPVAMLSSIYSGDLTGSGSPIGYSGTIGELSWSSPVLLGGTVLEADYSAFAPMAHELGHSLGLSHTTEIGEPINLGGFMQATFPFPALSLLGPSVSVNDGYQTSNQWFNWALRIGNKVIPRPNAFAWVGCDNDNDCPSQLECWIDTGDSLGVCRWPP